MVWSVLFGDITEKTEQYHSFWKVAVEERGKMRVRYLPIAEGRRLHIDEFPNFSASGSIKGMKEKYYGTDAQKRTLKKLDL